jgi:hypothetical protein
MHLTKALAGVFSSLTQSEKAFEVSVWRKRVPE